MPFDTLTPADAGAISRRARKLLRLRLISHREFALLDALTWSCRTSGSAIARVSYGQLQAAARLARATVAAGLLSLERLGLIRRTRNRVLVVGANGGRVWKQLTSTYRLLVERPAREFSGRTDSQTQIITTLQIETSGPSQTDARGALERIAAERAARQGAAWLRERGWG